MLSANFMATAVRVVHESHCPDIGPVCAERDEPPQLHDQLFYVTELRPIAEYGLTDNFGVELQLPLRLSATKVVYRRLSGELYEPDYVNIHHRDETLVGLGDPWLSARAGARLGAWTVGGRLGVSVPLGSTEENPFALGRAGLEHQHIQFGTGTFNPLAALEAAYTVASVELRGYAQTQLMLYENRRGYQAGNRYGAGALAEMRIAGELRVSAGADVVTEMPERWEGVVEQDGNLGRTDFLLGASALLPLGAFTASLGVKVPVYQHVIRSPGHDGGQLTYPAIVSLGLRRTFDLKSP